jgi:hypothetical protein
MAGVAPFASGECHARALGRPGGARLKSPVRTSVLRISRLAAQITAR